MLICLTRQFFPFSFSITFKSKEMMIILAIDTQKRTSLFWSLAKNTFHLRKNSRRYSFLTWQQQHYYNYFWYTSASIAVKVESSQVSMSCPLVTLISLVSTQTGRQALTIKAHTNCRYHFNVLPIIIIKVGLFV